MKKEYTDTELLDYLESLNGGYTGKIICRMSFSGKGLRLHETSMEGSSSSVREAIVDAIEWRMPVDVN